MHGGTNPGAPKGNKNAFVHGNYSNDAIAARRAAAELRKQWRELEARVTGR